jgi:hypothetical protein
MADLGSLNFSVHLKDCTEQDYEQIKKKLVEKQVKLNTKLGVKVDRQIIRESIDNALKSKIFKVNVGVNKINVPSEVKAKLKIDDASLRDSISSAVNKKKYKINIVVDKAKVSDAVKQALQKAGYKYNTTASDVRQQRILDIQAKMAERAALAEQRLTNARMQAARASGTHNAAMTKENTALSSQSRIAGELKNQIANVYSIYTLERFVRGLYTIGGEFQKQHIALTSILGDSMKAETIFNRIKDLAVVSPFQFKELASYTKQLSAYSIPYEELYDTTKRLADISAGVGVDMGRIILAYGQVRSAAFLRGQELRQFTEAGIPLVDELAKRFTKLTGVVTSAGDVFDKISRKEVSFGMVKDVLWELTDEGGKFYNMQEALAESLAGKWSNLQDAWDVMMADIAEGNSGVLSDSLELLTDLMKHWEAVADILGILVGIYGSYKTAVIAVNVAQKSSFAISQMQAYYTWLNKGVKVTKAAAVAQWALNSAMKVNPWVFWITTLGAIVTTLTVFQEKVETVAEKTKKLNIEFSKNIEKIKEEESKAKGYISRIFDKTNGIDAQRRAYLNLQKIYPSLFENMKFEQFLLEGEYQAIQKVLSASKEREKVKSAGLVIGATNNRNEAQRELNRLKSRREYYQSLDGYENVIESLDEDIKKQEEVLSQAQKTLNDALENYSTYKIKKDDKNSAWFKKATELYEKFGIERLKPDAEGGLQKYIENIIGANEDASSTLSEWTKKEGEWNEETRKSIDKAKLLKNATDEILKTFGRVTKETQNTKDPIAEQWEARTDLIDKAVSSYEKWRKIEGEEVASQRVKGISEFAPIFDKNGVNLDLKDPSKAYKYIQGQLDRSKEKQEDLYISLGVKIDKAGIDSAKKEVDDALKEIEKYVSQTGEKWDLYKKLFNASGNKSLSMNIAFGGEVSFKSIIDDFQSQLSEALKKNGSNLSAFDVLGMDEEAVKSKFGDNEILKLYQTIKSENEKIRAESVDNLSQMLSNYKDYAQKIKDIERNLQKDLADIESQRGQLGEEETDRLIAQRKKKANEDIASIEFEQFKQEINWELIFGDLDRVSKKVLEQVRQQLQAFKNSNEYKNMAVDQKKVVDEALNNIQSAIIDKGGLLGNLPEQLDELRAAQEKLNEAQEEYNKSLQTGTKAEQEEALKKRNIAAQGVQNAQVNVTKSTDKTKQNLITLSDAITQLGSSSEMSLSQIGSLASGFIDIFTEAGNKIGGIIGAVFSLLDAIDKQGIDGFVGNIFKSIANVWVDIFEKFSIPGLLGIDFGGDSDENLERDIEYLTQSNEDLKNALDNLSEKMDKASVTDASDIYEVQRENILKQQANTLEAMQRSAAAYNNGFLGIGGSHSTNKKIDENMSASEWKRVSDIVGKSVSNAGQFFQLSSKQMAKLAEEDTALYSKIKSLADDGYRNAAQYMDEYITYYKQLEELENAYNEKLTNTSFDNIRNDFKNALLDMESDAEDFANNFEKMMQNAIVESLMAKKYNKLIQEWYEMFAKAMESGGGIDKQEQADLQNKWNNIVNQALAERDALKEAMDWKGVSSSSGLSKGIQGITEDTANLLGSYLNGIRQDVSVKRALLEKLGNEIFPKYNILAEQQLTQLRAIANNTLRTANSNEAILNKVSELRDEIHSAKLTKDKGFYFR